MLRRVGNCPLVPLLGAGPAALFQVAHPLVAASVVGHSDLGADLWRRWLRTVRALYLIAFGSRDEADAVGQAVADVHGRISGRTTTALGVFPVGTPYAATDPELLLWVNASLTDVAMRIYGRLVRRLTTREQERFYGDMTVVARIVGVPGEAIPPTLGDFRAYLGERLGGSEIAVTAPAREIAAAVVDGPLPAGLRWLGPAHRLSTAGMLPPRLRDEYGLRWHPGRALALGVAASSIRAAAFPLLAAAGRIPLLPTGP